MTEPVAPARRGRTALGVLAVLGLVVVVLGVLLGGFFALSGVRHLEQRAVALLDLDPRLVFVAVVSLPFVELGLLRLTRRWAGPGVVRRLRDDDATQAPKQASKPLRVLRGVVLAVPVVLVAALIPGRNADAREAAEAAAAGLTSDQHDAFDIGFFVVVFALLVGSTAVVAQTWRGRLLPVLLVVGIYATGGFFAARLEPLHLGRTDGLPGLSAVGQPFDESFVDDVEHGLTVEPEAVADPVPGTAVADVRRGGCSAADVALALGGPAPRVTGCRATLTVAVTGPDAGERHVYGMVEVQTEAQGATLERQLATTLPTGRAAAAERRVVLVTDRDSVLKTAQELNAALALVQLGSPR